MNGAKKDLMKEKERKVLQLGKVEVEVAVNGRKGLVLSFNSVQMICPHSLGEEFCCSSDKGAPKTHPQLFYAGRSQLN